MKILKKEYIKGALKSNALLQKLISYFLIIVFGFIFLYPLIYMVLKSFMPIEDLLNPLVNLVPSEFVLENYTQMFTQLGFFNSLLYSVFLAGISALLQTLSCAIIGYGFSRFEFKLKKVFLALVVATFIIPTQITMIPTYMAYSQTGIIGSVLAFFIPAVLGQGLKSAIFILIFYSFFNTIPKVLDEAAQIDGGNPFIIFLKVALPLAKPALLLTFLFSLVWYWNETYLASLYIGEAAKTLPLQLGRVIASLESQIQAENALPIYESIKMAGSIITIIPLLLIYTVLQRQFVESIDRTGIAGE